VLVVVHEVHGHVFDEPCFASRCDPGSPKPSCRVHRGSKSRRRTRRTASAPRWVWGARLHSAGRQDGRWRIGAAGLAEAFLHARLLFDATGRPAKLARRFGARRILHQAQVATVLRWPAAGSQSAWLDIESVPNGWWYAVSDPSGAQIIARFADYAGSLPYTAIRDMFAATHYLKLIISPSTEPAHQAVLNAESTVLDRCAGDGWLAIGDAAAAFDPIASQGLPNALASAHPPPWRRLVGCKAILMPLKRTSWT
jgi:flavin-dependent dehydrogenase